jgi:O-acetyl-ADP-ribose deacetylase (regulator of RNase III)
MLTYHRTSLLTSRAQTVVNTVNTVGVMGKGIAAAFKLRYPEMFRAYKKLCEEKQLDIGKLWLWKATDQWILSFPTKKHWRNPSRLTYIDAGLQKFVSQYEQRGIREVAFPRLGCGNGGLDWEDVQPLMESYLSPLPIPVYIHDFEVDIGMPEHREHPLGEGYRKSFNIFLNNIGELMNNKQQIFYTVSNQTPFKAMFDDGRNLHIERAGRRHVVSNDELYEMWSLLLRGPLTRRKMPGAARDNAYYIFPILAHLPYVRPVEIAQRDDQGAIAVELLDDALDSKEVSDQGRFEWA